MVSVSGVQIGPGVRLLVPDDGSAPVLFHETLDGDWCETVLTRRALRGSFDRGDLITSKPIECSGGHVAGVVVGGAWQGIAVSKEPTDG